MGREVRSLPHNTGHCGEYAGEEYVSLLKAKELKCAVLCSSGEREA